MWLNIPFDTSIFVYSNNLIVLRFTYCHSFERAVRISVVGCWVSFLLFFFVVVGVVESIVIFPIIRL